MKTPVEWLAEQMLWNEFHNPYLEQAKEMEKEQIIKAYEGGETVQFENAEQYYNQTFKQ
jgi:hypothetical protein